ncbi:MATE efflux family protein [Suillus clintonianus]|uniref:MATE efflux family protein n=1 Tax=Suillus clintonianus TaxID=1904413 RepID=UPI001B8727CA|nr:MATE efflux family protein [Suillus clintonianus]KAG2134116.1 MATE efflux family protein [Suillus clintonianus]
MAHLSHLSGTSSSLPQDYAILSRFAAPPSEETQEELEVSPARNDQEECGEEDGLLASRKQVRRTSFPSSYILPPQPSMNIIPTAQNVPQPTENTPLLAPFMPRIQEDVDFPCDGQEPTTAQMYWEELRILCKYALPVFGTHVFEHSMIMASVVSIGHISTVALAAATIGFMTANVTGLSIIHGLVSSLDTMLPGAWTSDQPQLVGLWTQRMAVVVAVTLIPMFAIWFNAEPILLLLRQDPEVARLAGIYLKWASLGLPAYAFNTISRRYFQSQGLFDAPTRIIVAVAPINVLLNYLLVWGPEPIRLGFIGAPIATSVSYNLVSIVSVVYGVFFVEKTAWHPISRRSFTSLGLLVQLGLGGVGQVASEWWSWELVGLAASFLGPTALATQSVLLSTCSSTFQAPFSLGVATSVRIGNLLGEKNARRAGVSANAAIILSAAIAAFFSAVLLIFRKSWGYLFNNDIEVVTLVASILPLLALFQVPDFACAITAGILRARGKQFTGALINLSAYYIIGIPFGLWLAFKQDLQLAGLWCGLTAALVYASTLGIWLCLRTDWKREVEKVVERLAVDKLRDEHADCEHLAQ